MNITAIDYSGLQTIGIPGFISECVHVENKLVHANEVPNLFFYFLHCMPPVQAMFSDNSVKYYLYLHKFARKFEYASQWLGALQKKS